MAAGGSPSKAEQREWDVGLHVGHASRSMNPDETDLPAAGYASGGESSGVGFRSQTAFRRV